MRWLMWHPESESIFEVYTDEAYQAALNDGLVEDVTGIHSYEQKLIQQQGEIEQRKLLEKLKMRNKENRSTSEKFVQRCLDTSLMYSCLNCGNFHEKENKCSLFNAVPPARVILFACEKWEDEIPF